MTPKEKAIKLVDSFDLPSGLMSIERKQCALIAVDEIIKSNPTNPLTEMYIELYSDMVDEAIVYWKQVKQEIEKL